MEREFFFTFPGSESTCLIREVRNPIQAGTSCYNNKLENRINNIAGGQMALPVLDTSVVDALKKLRDNVKNDIDLYASMDRIQELVVERRLVVNAAYKPLLKSVCDLLREKGYPQTAKALEKDWRL
jgi:hypothetical protein